MELMENPEVKKEAKHVGRRIAKIGYLANGVMWILMGSLALQASFGLGSTHVDQKVVFIRLFSHPIGRPIMIALAVGLASYGIWRLLQAFFDPDNIGKGFLAIINRTSYVVTGLVYAGMALAAIEISLGLGNGGDTEEITRIWTAEALRYPLGSFMVGLIGFGITALGVYQIYSGFSEKFDTNFRQHKMLPEEYTWALRIGRFGHISRAIVMSTVGVIFIHAALRFDPDEVGFFGQALRSLSQQPYGMYIVAVLGLGLIALGLYSLVLARYRRIDW